MISWPFIESLEGNRLTGYVPSKDGAPLGSSGVTIASGVDLGQMSRAQIAALPIPAALRSLLAPYAGIKGSFAQRTLSAAPLAISQDDADALNAVVRAAYIRRLTDGYNAAVGPGLPGFDALPDAAQTAIASVGFQYGDLAAKCPRFWHAAVAQDWPTAIAELRNFGDAFPTRRRTEADYLGAILVA